jgi:cobalt-precorrin-5B (C1)-methyltransferase
MQKKLRRGYTTGTCAQAATKAAMQMLFSGREVREVSVELPQGEILRIEIQDIHMEYGENQDRLPEEVSCAVKKDSGDDPDVTNGTLVYSKVLRTSVGGVVIDGGTGIGRVTKPGLEQPIGAAAINRVPRQMIQKEVKNVCEEVGYPGGIFVEISIPEGERLAEKTFNPRLGIKGGLSVLGTSGIVEPMSEQAIVDTIRVELKVKLAENNSGYLVTAPGNYGLSFLEREYGIRETEVVKCSNYIGQTIDMAQELGCKGLLLTGHIGKLIKVAGGIMNTHSKWADCRMELLAAAALRAGIENERIQKLMNCLTTDDALAQCTEAEREHIMEQVMEKIEYYLKLRASDEMEIGAIVFSNVYGILGKTANADEMIRRGRAQE